MPDLSQSTEAGESRSQSSDASPEQTASPETSQPRDWRLVAILTVAALLLLAVYINKRYYPKDGEAPTSVVPKESMPEGPPQAAPPLSPEERYATLIRRREFEVTETMFTLDDKAFLVACPPMPIRSKDDPKRVLGLRPGMLFDVSKRLEGVTPMMLHRRGLPGSREITYLDRFPPLGVSNGISMTIKGAEEITLADVSDTEGVIGVILNDEARAYPIRFANYHEVINDTLGGTPVAITWSALVNAASAMERRDDTGAEIEFGASWLMYQGAIVPYDIATRSLWSPLQRLCIVGERMGTSLKPVPAVVTSWSAWKEKHPETTVLVGTDPVLRIDYGADPSLPSGDYWRSPNVLYPVYGFNVSASPIPMKSYVFGVTGPDGEACKAYEGLALRNNGVASFEDTINGQKVLINYDSEARILSATDTEGAPLLVESMIWLCWSGLHPDTEVWNEETLRQTYGIELPTDGLGQESSSQPQDEWAAPPQTEPESRSQPQEEGTEPQPDKLGEK